MSLTRGDKKWIRDTVREVLVEILDNKPVEQIGGYDGVHPFVEDIDESEYNRRRKHVGFHLFNGNTEGHMK